MEPGSSSDVSTDGDDLAFTAEDIPPDASGFGWFDTTPSAPGSEGDIIDGVIVDDEKPEPQSRLKSGGRGRMLDRDPKSGQPALSEWMDFFGRIIIRGLTDFYIDVAFRNIDEDLLSDREVERIHLRPEERERMARPFAELACKLKVTKKHGRAIIASGESIDAVLQLGMWITRVNRIAAKYRDRESVREPETMRSSRASYSASESRVPSGEASERYQAPEPERVNSGEVSSNGSIGSDQAARIAATLAANGGRPRIAGEVFNPTRA